MKIQKIYIEAYVNNGVQLDEELDEQLNDDDRCSYRNVLLISEDETNDTFPEDKEERIREQMNLINNLLDNDEIHLTSEVGDMLQNIAENLSGMLL